MPTRGDGRVLVVEDDPAVRDVLASLLGRTGFDVVAVADGSEAIARTEVHGPFDSMVTDVVLPGTSGIELAALMMDRDPLMGGVLLSGFTVNTPDLQRVLADGVTSVSKPIASGPLLQAVLGSGTTRR